MACLYFSINSHYDMFVYTLSCILILGCLCFIINSHYGMFVFELTGCKTLTYLLVFEYQFSLCDVYVLALILIMGCLCSSISFQYGMFVS